MCQTPMTSLSSGAQQLGTETVNHPIYDPTEPLLVAHDGCAMS